ncbi:MAG TPA: winged helix-turn-helix domain-containing protein [Actinomycetota bacterium]|nr:winged helix-turn-helix domain-containing protein [Actinomycetota bacterium]
MAPSMEGAGGFELEIDSEHHLKVLSVSEDLLNLHGVDDGEVKAEDAWRAFVASEDQAGADAIIKQLRTGTGWVGRFRTRTKAGERLIFEIDADPEPTSSGTVLVHGHAKNVTGRAELEAALRREEAKLRLLCESVPVVLWSTDKDLRVTWTSGPGLETLGLQQDDLVGVTLREYFGTDDKFIPIAAQLRALEGEATTFDVRWMERIWRATVESTHDEVGDINGVVGVGIDVTDQAVLQEEALELGRDVAHLAVAADASFSSFSAPSAEGAIDIGGLRIAVAAHRVIKEGRTIGLTPTEFKLLVALGQGCGRVLERSFLLETVWGYDFAAGGSPLSMTVRRLREKIEHDPQNPTRLETIRGIGYRLNPV